MQTLARGKGGHENPTLCKLEGVLSPPCSASQVADGNLRPRVATVLKARDGWLFPSNGDR